MAEVNIVGKVLAVNISEAKGEQKKPVTIGKFIEDFGIEGDAHAGKWHRQVSLLANESIDKIRAHGMEHLSAGDFAENITTEGIMLHEIPVGSRLKIGETIQEVTQIGKECHHHCEVFKVVGDCVMPREGIFTKVIKGGSVKSGDLIELIH